MKNLEFTGLDAAGAQKTANELQQLLADLHVFYMNLRGYHWHIQGEKFFVLHEKFEEIYDSVNEQIDEVAERILMLDASPQNKFSEYLKLSNIKEDGGVSGVSETVKGTLNAFKVLLAQMRKVSAVADEVNDSVTVGMMDGYLEGHEKTVWMLVAFAK